MPPWQFIMRLLNTRTGEFKWIEDPRQVYYAVLSHVWAKPGDPEYAPEQTYQDLLRFQEEARTDGTLPISKFSDKLRRFCETALRDGIELGWADTCCIDKTSSSELSEAINSMYSWYAYSGACYAFLRDVNPPTEGTPAREWRISFRGSEWFKRGWTLQELIAPRTVIFVSKAPEAYHDGWEVLGSKHNLAACISSETGIDVAVLTFERSPEEIPIAQRMAWMQSRETTRLEDEAYCLMGIFGVNMQTNYGEGRYAFVRLQEKILSQSPDQTIFAWGPSLDDPSLIQNLLRSSPSGTPTVNTPPNLSDDPATSSFPEQYLLASSPKDFSPEFSAKLICLSREEFWQCLGFSEAQPVYQVFEITPFGLRAPLPVLDLHSFDEARPVAPTHCAFLACKDPDRGLLALLLRLVPKHHKNVLSCREFFAGASVAQHNDVRQLALGGGMSTYGPVWDNYCRIVYISQERLKSLRTSPPSTSAGQPRMPPRVPVIYIPHCPRRSAIELEGDSSIHTVLCSTMESFEVEFSWVSKRVLERDGYNVSQVRGAPSQSPDGPSAPPRLKRTPSSGSRYIIISGKFGVYLTIQVARCACALATRSGVLGVLVSSRDPDSLDGKSFSQERHHLNHPIHINSWSFDHGSASRRIDFDSPQDMRRLSLRLVLTS